MSSFTHKYEFLAQGTRRVAHTESIPLGTVCACCLDDVAREPLDSDEAIECDILQIKKCRHYFCLDCLNKVVQHHSRCPICRDKLFDPPHDDESDEEAEEDGDQSRQLEQLVAEACAIPISELSAAVEAGVPGAELLLQLRGRIVLQNLHNVLSATA